MLHCGVALSRGWGREKVALDPAVLLPSFVVLVAVAGAIPTMPRLWQLAQGQDPYQTYAMIAFAHPAFHFNVLRRLLSLLLCVGLFLYVRDQDERFAGRTVNTLLWTGVVIMAIGLTKAMGWFEAPSPFYPVIDAYSWLYPGTSLRRAVSVFGNPQWYAEYLILILPLFVIAGMRAGSWRRWMFLLFALVCALSAALTILRMAWVAVGGSILLLSWHAAALRRRGMVSARFLYGAAVVLVCILLVGLISYRALPQQVVFDKVRHFAATPRWKLWEDSISLMRAKPLLGYGIGSYMWAYEENVERRRWALHHGEAHNTYLTMGVEGGIASLAAFLAFLSCVLRAGYRRAGDCLAISGVFVGLMATFLFVAMTVNVFFLRGIELLIWIYFALAVGRGALEKSGSDLLPAEVATSKEFGRTRAALVVVVALALVLPGLVRFWPQSAGFYGWEVAPDGTRFRWSHLKSQMCEPVRGGTFALPIVVAHPDATTERPVEVTMRVNGEVVGQYEFGRRGGYELRYTLPAGDRGKGRVRIGLALDRTWQPQEFVGVETRLLGLQARGLRWE